MTKYEPVTVARVRAIFLWTLLLMPLALFILALVISLVFKGYSKTVSEVKEFLSGIEVIPAIAYLIVFASAFTLILVFVNLINNYRWKKFFTSDAINAMRAYGFTFDHEGIDGLYKGVRVAIRYFISKDTESAYVHL